MMPNDAESIDLIGILKLQTPYKNADVMIDGMRQVVTTQYKPISFGEKIYQIIGANIDGVVSRRIYLLFEGTVEPKDGDLITATPIATGPSLVKLYENVNSDIKDSAPSLAELYAIEHYLIHELNVLETESSSVSMKM